MNKNEYKYEQDFLDSTIDNIGKRKYFIREIMQNKNSSLRNGDLSPDTLAVYQSSKREISMLEKVKYNPYFGRIDIESEEGAEIFYIGKQGVFDKEENIIVLDWRNPMASVYYNFTPGQPVQNYTVEDERNRKKYKYEVLVNRKREFTINEGKIKKIIQHVKDVKDKGNTTMTDKGVQLTVTDEFLKEIIEQTETTGYLKEIVASIQEEQNKAIRQPLNKNLIIQGVAGSGKSSIALHRLSYLLFNNKHLKPEDILILGPSNMFISSFKNLLPELNLEGIAQSTFYHLAKNVLKKSLQVEPKDEVGYYFENVLFNEDALQERKRIEFVGSENFATLIDTFLEEYKLHYENRFQTISLFTHILSVEEQVNIFQGYAYLPFAQRINRFINHVVDIYKRELDRIKREWEDQCDSIIGKFLADVPFDKEKKAALSKDLRKVETHKKQKYEAEFKEFTTKWKKRMSIPSLFDMYKQMLSTPVLSSMKHIINEEMVREFSGYQIKKVSSFDLPALLYIFYSFYEEPKHYSHVVIDEAQDSSYMHYLVVKKISKTMTILGDVDQSLFMSFGQQSWNNLKAKLFDNQSTDEYLEMNISYRSTKQIINLANQVLANQFSNRKAISALNRNGDDISFSKVNDGESLLKGIHQTVTEWKRKYKRIAIIHKDEKRAEKIAAYLTQIFKQQITYVRPDQPMEENNIYVLSSYNSKGMEFDAVILVNVSEETFPKDDLHARLLYVLVTRAQQEVKIFYQGSHSKLLEGAVKEKELVYDSRFDDIL
ncbi:HelD family protein [Sutcliffiella horikoshii]|uniref:HelD family protein n=1 Tax=Sutcliffiella horikoshii TaxID=79883 RepID=UPI0038514D10